MSEGDTLHSLEEFPQFPWDQLEMKTFNSGPWGLSRGGWGIPDYRYCLDRMDSSGACERWQLPTSLGLLLEHQLREGKELAQHQIRAALGVGKC